GGNEGVLADLGWKHDALTAWDKLQHAIPAEQFSLASETTQRFYVDETPWFNPVRTHPTLNTIQEALWQNRKLTLHYAKPASTVTTPTVCPYALVAKVGVWYLVGAHDNMLRVYRVSRIQQALPIDERFERPLSFDLQQFWTSWTREFETSRPLYEALLWISNESYDQFIRATPWPICRTIPEGNQAPPPGFVAVQVMFETAESACRHILSFGAEIRAIAPLTLGEMVLDRALRIVAWEEDMARRVPRR
ncbi:MAG: helix-turn-helix transcriptional regulator, partial [Sulfobacillus sp.]